MEQEQSLEQLLPLVLEESYRAQSRMNKIVGNTDGSPEAILNAFLSANDGSFEKAAIQLSKVMAANVSSFSQSALIAETTMEIFKKAKEATAISVAISEASMVHMKAQPDSISKREFFLKADKELAEIKKLIGIA